MLLQLLRVSKQNGHFCAMLYLKCKSNHFLMILRISVSCIVINNDTYFRYSSKFTTLSWKQVITRFQDDYSKVLQLFDLVLTLPATSTACERGFSHMKLIKTDIRSSLSENTLSNSILIKLHSPTIGEFDPTPAIEHWLRQREDLALVVPKTTRKKVKRNYILSS